MYEWVSLYVGSHGNRFSLLFSWNVLVWNGSESNLCTDVKSKTIWILLRKTYCIHTTDVKLFLNLIGNAFLIKRFSWSNFKMQQKFDNANRSKCTSELKCNITWKWWQLNYFFNLSETTTPIFRGGGNWPFITFITIWWTKLYNLYFFLNNVKF